MSRSQYFAINSNDEEVTTIVFFSKYLFILQTIAPCLVEGPAAELLAVVDRPKQQLQGLRLEVREDDGDLLRAREPRHVPEGGRQEGARGREHQLVRLDHLVIPATEGRVQEGSLGVILEQGGGNPGDSLLPPQVTGAAIGVHGGLGSVHVKGREKIASKGRKMLLSTRGRLV